MHNALQTLKTLLEHAEELPLALWVFVTLFLLLLLAIKYDQHKHLVFRFAAKRRLNQLQKLPTEKDKMIFLKTTHHFVFEEMILTKLKKRGAKIKRNKKYTGDGGIDGRCWINKNPYLIQAKRYKDHINPAHVTQFAQICRKHQARGLFIHTGKTGPMSKSEAKKHKIKIVSGNALIEFFE